MKKPKNYLSIKSKITLLMSTMIVSPALFFVYFIITFRIDATNRTIIQNPYILLAVMTLLLIVYFMFAISLLSRYIFMPLSEMKKAAEHIKAGNLNYPIDYCPENEFGEFCSEFDKMRIRLKDTILEQHELEKRRKRLIASITHDLRTPLTSIKGYVEALQDGIVKDEETYNQYLETINQKADLLNHLIDDLSVFTKQELGEFTLNIERINSGKLLKHYFGHKKSEFQYTNIRLILNQPFIATYINVDPYRFNQILDNLIGNAKKYAHSKIEISTYVVNYHLRISISDDGEGIPNDYLQNLFDPFFMVNKKKDQKEKRGSGLGLAIVKQLTEAHDGTIQVESTYGKGSTFTIDIPIDR